MSIQESYQSFIQKLDSIYDLQEAKSIARIVYEDAFQIFNFQKKTIFPKKYQRQFEDIQNRLLQHEPVQYILGQADFYGLKLKVEPSVLIPRQETEELVHWVLEQIQLKKLPANSSVLDIGTGSGCIPIVIKKKMPFLDISAVDVSEDALRIAAENARRHDTHIQFHLLNILDALHWETFQEASLDIIVSNPPYIPRREWHLIPKQVLDFEPQLALFVENEQALVFYENIVRFASQKLRKRACLFFECNEFNAKEVVKLLKKSDFENIELKKDLRGKDRLVKGRKY